MRWWPAIVLAMAIPVLAGSIPSNLPISKIYQWDSRIEDVQPISLYPTRGETMHVFIRCFSYQAPWQFTNSNPLVVMIYTPIGSTNAYALPGAVTTNNQIQFIWTPANELAESTYRYEVWVSGPTSDVIAAKGAINLAPGIDYSGGVHTNQPIWWISPPTNRPASGQGLLWSPSGSYWGSLVAVASFGTMIGSPYDNAVLSNALMHAGQPGTNGLDGAQGLPGPPGQMGPPGTQAVVYVGAEVGPVGPSGRDGRDGRDGVIGRDGLPGITPTISVTNTMTGDAACTNVGTSTNVVLQFTLPPGPQGPAGPGMTNMPAVWDADSIGTNRLAYKVGGVVVGYVDTNGLTLYQGTITLWENDLRCNVMTYDGSRMAPAISLQGHPGEAGWYGRGYLGSYGWGYTARSNDVFVAWAGGIKMLSTNAAFDGKHVGDATSLYNYPEPMLTNWLGTRALPSITITNAGSITVVDTNGVPKFIVNGANGAITIRGQDSDSRYVLVNTNWPDFVQTNVFAGITNRLWYADGIVTNKFP